MPSPASGEHPLRAAVVILAAGEGRRSGAHTNKVLLPLAGRRVFTWSIRWARLHPSVRRTVLVVRDEDREEVARVLDREVGPPEVTVVTGGDSRHASEWRALQALAPAIGAGEVDVVVIHDAARPLAGTWLFGSVVETAAAAGGAVPVRSQPDLVAIDPADPAADDSVVAVQTPQAFLAEPLLHAYTSAEADGFVGTDTASCMEAYTDLHVLGVPGDAGNIKITFAEDLFLAERLLAKAGYDLSATPDAPGTGRDGDTATRRLPHRLRRLWSGGAS